MIQGRRRLRSVCLGLGIALAAGAVAQSAPPPQVKVHYSNRRSFRMPVNIPAAEVPRTREIQLWVSSDRGASWAPVATTAPNQPAFNFAAKADGLYWFAARRVDTEGRLFPADDAEIEPNMKVTIDTKKPTMTITPRARRANVATIEWDVTDEALDLATLAFEFQADGATEWAPVPIPKPARIGVEQWDAGTAQPLKVRGTVADKAGNRQSVTIALPDGGATDEQVATPADRGDFNTPPAIGGGGTFVSTEATPRPVSNPKRPRAENAGDHDPFANGAEAATAAAADPAPAGGEPAAPPILVASPKFGLQYAVEDAGPTGPARVELFVTNDGGRTWASRGEDPDRTSPFDVDLGGEGRYGLKLVAKSAANQGDRPPVPGEAPQTAVEVDTSGPAVTLERPQLAGNKLVITWHANDAHPTSRPVMISIKADAPDARWQIITPTPVENTGQYQWLISAKCPPKIHVRVDVRDALNNLGFAETNEADPVIVDRTRPKGRILGLDTNRTTR